MLLKTPPLDNTAIQERISNRFIANVTRRETRFHIRIKITIVYVVLPLDEKDRTKQRTYSSPETLKKQIKKRKLQEPRFTVGGVVIHLN